MINGSLIVLILAKLYEYSKIVNFNALDLNAKYIEHTSLIARYIGAVANIVLCISSMLLILCALYYKTEFVNFLALPQFSFITEYHWLVLWGSLVGLVLITPIPNDKSFSVLPPAELVTGTILLTIPMALIVYVKIEAIFSLSLLMLIFTTVISILIIANAFNLKKENNKVLLYRMKHSLLSKDEQNEKIVSIIEDTISHVSVSSNK